MAKFIIHTEEEQQTILAALFPQGKVWDAKNINTSIMYKLLYSYGIELKYLEEKLNYIFDEFNFQTCDDMIVDWEKEYGIYGGCFADLVQEYITEGATGLPKRINLILTLIKATNCHTEQDFIDIAYMLGYVIEVTAGCNAQGGFPYVFPFDFGDQGNAYKMYIKVISGPIMPIAPATFTETFPFQFGELNYESPLRCFLEQLKPANSVIEWS